MHALSWIENTWVALLVAESSWAYPLVLTLHGLGMAIVVGIVFMINFRVLGFAPDLPITTLERLVPLAWAGFAVNFVSGALLFAPKATEFIVKVPFLVKMAAIIAGGLALWLLLREVTIEAREQRDGRDVSGKAKITALAGLGCWLAAIVAGRLIAYIR